MLKFAALVPLLYALILTQSVQAETSEPEIILAPGWGNLGFEAPAVGSYELPRIRTAAGGAILDVDGKSLDLNDLLGEKITVLSFIYRTCGDVNGCPLSTMVLRKLAAKVGMNRKLENNLRLLTLSFDPEFDTPAAMKDFGQIIRNASTSKNGETDWQFLTSSSDEAIQPILEAYQQSVISDPENVGGESRKFSHILRVYLIDREKQIRNIYSVSFLHPDILVNDVLTLIGEEHNRKNEKHKLAEN